MMTSRLYNHLCEIVILLNNSPNHYAEIGDVKPGEEYDKNSYLLRYDEATESGEGYNMVLMGDLGVTWEPSSYTTTEKYGEIQGENPNDDANALIQALNNRKQERTS